MSARSYLQDGHSNSQSFDADFTRMTKALIDSFSDWQMFPKFNLCTAGFDFLVTSSSNTLRFSSSSFVKNVAFVLIMLFCSSGSHAVYSCGATCSSGS